MYRIIVVPLDGSPFAAQSVATGAEIARRAGAGLVLARVHEPYAYEHSSTSFAESTSLQDETEYIDEIAERVEDAFGVRAERRILDGAIVPSLCRLADERTEALIVMSTHGRTGFNRLWLGSTADGVARHASAPVLMLRHHGAERGFDATPHPFARIVVPLDGGDQSRRALPYAMALAALFGSRLTLVRAVTPVVVPSWVYAAPNALAAPPVPDTLRSRADTAREYLGTVAARLRAQNSSLDVSAIVHVSESPALGILEAVADESADTIALATHGRGSSRLMLPSVTDKILRAGPEAVLMVRASAQE